MLTGSRLMLPDAVVLKVPRCFYWVLKFFSEAVALALLFYSGFYAGVCVTFGVRMQGCCSPKVVPVPATRGRYRTTWICLFWNKTTLQA